MIKNVLNKIKDIFLKNYFWVCGVLSLLIPDLLIRSCIAPNLFEAPFSTTVPALFTAFWVCLVIFICIVIIPPKAGRIVFVVFSSLMSIMAFSSYIYYQIFNQFFWLSSIGLVGEAGNYIRYALSYLDPRIIISTLISVGLIILAAIGWHKKPIRPIWLWAFVIIPIIGLFSVHIYMDPERAGETEGDWDSWNKPRIVYSKFTDANKSMCTAGMYQFMAKDLWNTWFPSNTYTEEDYKSVDEFFASKGDVKANDYTGIFEGKNVIAVMMESIDDWMISDKYTPTISYMMKNGINLTKHFAPTFGTGATFNTEFAFNTGYYTPESAATAVNFSTNSYPYSLANLFKKSGYSVNSFHYNTAEFYNRGIMHKSFGYEAYNSFTDFGMTNYAAQSDSNILKNDAIYEKMIGSDKFFDFVITYSGHVPYTYDDSKLVLARTNHPDLVDPSMDKETNNLLILARDTDDFFRMLLERLEKDNLLGNTVIIGFSDHYAYGFSNAGLLTKYSLEAGSGLFQLVPAFIYNYGAEPTEVTKVTQSVDLLPTIANLMGLENPDCYIGSDAFNPDYTGFVHFPNFSWFNGELYYSPDTAEIPKGKETLVAERGKYTEKLIDINDIVISGDYFNKRK